MAIIKQRADGHGSLKDIQLLVNKNQGLIDECIKTKFRDTREEQAENEKAILLNN